METEGIQFFTKKELQEQLLSDGCTHESSEVVPNQDLQSGTLTFEILPGYVEDIVLTNPKARTQLAKCISLYDLAMYYDVKH